MIRSLDDVLAIMIITGIFCGIISSVIAGAKHRSVFGWLVLGFFFNGLSLVAISAIPKNAKTCPKCREFSPYGARVCQYCNYEFMSGSQEITE